MGSVALRHLIGSGRHGTVFLGTVEHRDAPVAIKIAAHGTDLTHEATALRTLAHPHVVQLVAIESPSTIAVEYCEGGTLADRTIEGPLPLREVRHIFAGVAAALGHVHRAGWIHGDINPQNIGLRPHAGAALLDFANARLADGSPLAAGPSAFAGKLRRAEPSFDIRCAAAAALDALGPDGHYATVTALRLLAERADAGERVHANDLETALGIDSETLVADSGYATHAGGPPRPPVTHTRDFGPQPDGTADAPENTDETSTKLPVLIAAAIALLIVCAVAVEFVLPSGTVPLATQPPISSGDRVVSADSTLRVNGASWDAASGTLSIDAEGESERWAVGAPGDLAAIGDWNCDGIPTLGVLRPTDGTWFTFNTWESGSTSTVTNVGAEFAPVTLQVQLNAAGCATPWIS